LKAISNIRNTMLNTIIANVLTSPDNGQWWNVPEHEPL